MLNGWKTMRWKVLAALGTLVSLPTVAAQSAQTADGAQQFLAATAKKVATKVYFVDAAGRTNYVTGKLTGQVKTIKGGVFGKPKETIAALPEQAVDKQLADVRASELDAIDAEGRPTACATRITTVSAPPYDDSKSDAGNESRAFTFTLTYTDQQWTYEPLTKFMNPAQVIDWSDAKISRNPDFGHRDLEGSIVHESPSHICRGRSRPGRSHRICDEVPENELRQQRQLRLLISRRPRRPSTRIRGHGVQERQADEVQTRAALRPRRCDAAARRAHRTPADRSSRSPDESRSTRSRCSPSARGRPRAAAGHPAHPTTRGTRSIPAAFRSRLLTRISGTARLNAPACALRPIGVFTVST